MSASGNPVRGVVREFVLFFKENLIWFLAPTILILLAFFLLILLTNQDTLQPFFYRVL